MSQRLGEELRALEERLLEMGRQVEEAIGRAVDALRNRDRAAAEGVIAGDAAIDRAELEIETTCLQLIALHQPMASDLRRLGTALKVITDLERMADHAVDIARATLRIGDEPLIKPLVDIPRMAEIARAMVRGALEAYLRHDADLAYRLVERDDELDGLYAQVFRELLVLMMGDPGVIRQAMQLLLVAQHLERVGDHATNVAEWVVYMVTGQRPALND